MQKSIWIAMLAGGLFGLGLLLSGMSNPHTVLGFLRLNAQWNPALLFVMVGAIGIAFFAFRQAKRQTISRLGWPMQLPKQTQIDRRLIIGAIMFGTGWGLAGFCPGPALVALAFGNLKPWLFVASMLVGMWLYSG